MSNNITNLISNHEKNEVLEEKSEVQRPIYSLPTSGIPKNALGNKLLKKYYEHGFLSRKEAMIAKCADCCGNYVDGLMDCEVEVCPLYQYMPYKIIKRK